MSDYEYIFGDIRLLKADRMPCPVCGHPTGDCTPENHTPPTKIFGLGLFKSMDEKQTFIVDRDIYEEQEILPNQTVNVIKFRKGQEIPLSTARELGLIK